MAGEITLRVSADLNRREVVLIERSLPTDCAPQKAEEACSATERLWLDEECMLVLRSELGADSDPTVISAVVTEFRPNVAHDPALFEFVPPRGAVDMTTDPDDENPIAR